MNLFHISDDPNIQQFEPRPANSSWPHLKKKYVWAVSEEMVHNFYVPRNCPRVCWMLGTETSKEGIALFQSYGSQRSIIFVEQAWKEEMERTVLFKYTFTTKNFHLIDQTAEYYISEQVEYPVQMESIYDLTSELKNANVLLVYVDCLKSYQELSVVHSFRFSNIRMKYANYIIKNKSQT